MEVGDQHVLHRIRRRPGRREAGREAAAAGHHPARAGVDQHPLAAHVDEESRRRWRATARRPRPAPPRRPPAAAASASAAFDADWNRLERELEAAVEQAGDLRLADLRRRTPGVAAGAAAGGRPGAAGARRRSAGVARTRRSARRRRSAGRAPWRRGRPYACGCLLGRSARAAVHVGIEQPVGVDDEVAHVRVVDGGLGLGLPGAEGRVVVRDRRRRSRPSTGRGTRCSRRPSARPRSPGAAAGRDAAPRGRRTSGFLGASDGRLDRRGPLPRSTGAARRGADQARRWRGSGWLNR